MRNALTRELTGTQSRPALILTAPPATAGMRAGSVVLDPSQEVGLHSTYGNEEAIVVLEGRGQLQLPDVSLDLAGPCVAYVPPHTPHNVVNTAERGALRYVYVVAPAADQSRER